MEFSRIFHLIFLTIVGTKERTEKISMSSIKTIVNEPIEGHEEYHIIVRFCTFALLMIPSSLFFLPLIHLLH